MPENTISVCRPGEYGNPFIVAPKARPGLKSGAMYICMPTPEDAVECFREMWEVIRAEQPERFDEMRRELAGKNLACFCALDQPCHADVLLDLANASAEATRPEQK